MAYCYKKMSHLTMNSNNNQKAKIVLPVSLTGLFDTSDNEDNDTEHQNKNEEENGFQNEYEISKVVIGGVELQIRQMVWHQANANIIWPGTYNLVDHILSVKDLDCPSQLRYETGKVLELGAATGALSLALRKSGNFEIITSDIDDGGIVEENIIWNYQHNGGLTAPEHIPHTWGNGWDRKELHGFKYIIASDILLYVSVYPNLVQTLEGIFNAENSVIEFLMSWNRRIQESTQFFQLMKEHGFQLYSHGKGLYSFYRLDRLDEYLRHLSNSF